MAVDAEENFVERSNFFKVRLQRPQGLVHESELVSYLRD